MTPQAGGTSQYVPEKPGVHTHTLFLHVPCTGSDWLAASLKSDGPSWPQKGVENVSFHTNQSIIQFSPNQMYVGSRGKGKDAFRFTAWQSLL